MSVNKTLGRLNALGIAKEATRGTTPGSPTFFINFDEVNIEEKMQHVLRDQAAGVIEDSQGMDIVRQWAEGSWKAPVTDKSFALVLLSLLGSLSSAANADASSLVYDHTITVAQNVQHQSLSLYLNDASATGDAQDYTHALAVVHAIELSYEAAAKFVEYTANVKAKRGVQTAVTVTQPTENRFLPQHVTFKVASSLSGLTAATAIKIRGFKLKMEDKADSDPVLGDVGPNDFLNQDFMIEGTVEATWDDEATFKTAALAGTSKALRIDANNGDVTIGTAAHPVLRIDLAKVTFKELSRPWKSGDIVRQTLGFKAHYSASDSKMVTILATNLTASY